jgi:hypothetical protein
MSLIKPNVYAELVREKFVGRVKVLQLASDLGMIPEFASHGETIVFPKWSLISDATEMAKGTPLVPEELQQTQTTATVKQVGKAIRVFDSENLTAIGNQLDEGARQTSIVMARKIDTDLIAEMLTSDLKSATANAKAITSIELDNALQLYGDERDVDDFAGIIVNSLLIPSFMGMKEFVDAMNTTVTTNNGIVRNGLLGFFRGIPVYVSDKGTYNTSSNECITFIIKKNALGYKMKKNIDIELEREAKLKATDIVADMMYAVKLVADDGVVIVKKTIA